MIKILIIKMIVVIIFSYSKLQLLTIIHGLMIFYYYIFDIIFR